VLSVDGHRSVALCATPEELALTAFERLFAERGLPLAIRSDNGVPFASPNGLFNLSKLFVWWRTSARCRDRVRRVRLSPGLAMGRVFWGSFWFLAFGLCGRGVSCQARRTKCSDTLNRCIPCFVVFLRCLGLVCFALFVGHSDLKVLPVAVTYLCILGGFSTRDHDLPRDGVVTASAWRAPPSLRVALFLIVRIQSVTKPKQDKVTHF
jgi:hypothetical protein